MIKNDLKILYNMCFKSNLNGDLKQRLDSFYKDQSSHYDSFRKRMLHGREELIEKIIEISPENCTTLDMGGATAYNIQLLSDKINKFKSIIIVDLCDPLLNVANSKILEFNWNNVKTINADASTFKSDEKVDVILFSYSLTMMPDWFLSLERAYDNLKPGGIICVVDFNISRKWVLKNDHIKHNFLTKIFWSSWFSIDNVFLNCDHLPWLETHFKRKFIKQDFGKIPYLPFFKVPYYIWIGEKFI